MKNTLAVFAFIALTALCWGTYAPVLNLGKAAMGGSGLLQFVCVGLAYFFIAVLAPGIWLATRGEVGHWSAGGIVWSLAAGAAGALGALGIIMALQNKGSPIYVAPLVFGCAPVVNTFYTIITTKNYKLSPLFLAGLMLVIAGAVTVLIFRPAHHAAAKAPAAESPAAEEGSEAKPKLVEGPTATQFMKIGAFIALTVLSWGVYGPVLHKGQTKMAGSRMRPLVCVGLAYFLIAVLIPLAVIVPSGLPDWTWTGAWWSLAGGAAGAVGALGIILAFNFGGKPIYVMPLVFGCAPVINTFTTMLTSREKIDAINPLFYAGLIIVAVGAVAVLVFAPKGGHGPKPAAGSAGHKDKKSGDKAEPAESKP